jgi:hypothetical protein
LVGGQYLSGAVGRDFWVVSVFNKYL